ncbi:MAG: four helix bundle protein [Ferruginibacter sp.]
MKVYSFEKLECWQQAKQQMRRAAISIASNLAEGTSRITKKDQSHFSTIAYSSTIEILNDLIICNELGFLHSNVYIEGRERNEKQTYLIAMLRKSQQEKAQLSKPPKPSKTSKPNL